MSAIVLARFERMNAVNIGNILKRRRIRSTKTSVTYSPKPTAQNRRSRPVKCIQVLRTDGRHRGSCIEFYDRLRSERIKLTTSGSIGSGSLPVIPAGVGEGAGDVVG